MYDLHKLGWNSFQQLCLTIVRQILGQTVEQYLDSYDGGRDGAFSGEWSTEKGENLSGAFVIQCKFTSKANQLLRTPDIADEVEKAKRLVERNLCDSYVLMTNAGVTARREEEIEKLLMDVGVKHTRILGPNWINQQIRENKSLRMLVPRIYGLGDLSQILDERAYDQAEALLESMREDLAKVIVTEAYGRAVDAINEHGFVLLIGEPAAGKSTIASLLAMAAVDNWDASLLRLNDPSSVIEHWNPNEPTQFFWLDDAFGVTQYEYARVLEWNHRLPQVQSMLQRGAKIVMASRDYIYNRARDDLKTGAFPLLNESQVVIDVHALSQDEKEQILYSHLKFGNQPRTFLTKIKPFLPDVASHPRFIPEMARRLSDPLFTRDLTVTREGIREFIEEREQLLLENIRGLDSDSKAALALIFMRNGRLESPIDLGASEKQALERLGSDLGKSLSALEAMIGSFVLLSYQGSERVWQFRHPTIGDAYAAVLLQSPEHVDIFIQGSDPKRLIGQVTCGDVGYENTIVIPNALFPAMIEKLNDLLPGSFDYPGEARVGDLLIFLSRRCSAEFLVHYLASNSEHLSRVSHPLPTLLSNPGVGLVIRLHELGILPEEWRSKFVETVSAYAIEGDDGSVLLDGDIRNILTEEEFKGMMQRIATELLPRLADVSMDWEQVWEWQDGDSPIGSPEDHIKPLLDYLHSLKEEFRDDESAVQTISDEIAGLNQWVTDINNWEPDSDFFENRFFEEVVAPLSQMRPVEERTDASDQRSIFDDIDAD